MHKSSSTKKFCVVVLMACMCLLVTGCSVAAANGIDTNFSNRLEKNRNLLDNLCSAGLVSEATREATNDVMESQLKKITMGTDEDGDTSEGKIKDVMNILMGAVTDWTRVQTGTMGTGTTATPLYDTTNHFTNYMVATGNKYTGNFKLSTEGNKVSPYVLIDSTTADNLNTIMGYKVYILNNDENMDLAKLHKYLSNAKKESPTTFKPLSNYFTELKDANGKAVTLLDTSKPENQLVKVTSGSPYVGSDQKVKARDPMLTLSSAEGIKFESRRLGEDMTVFQEDVPIMSVRLVEFNQDAYDNIVKKLGMSDNRYLVSPSQNAVYLLQYPVGYVSGLSVDSTNSTYETLISKSSMEVNLSTGKLYKVFSDGSSKEMSDIDPYVKVSLDVPKSSSFEIYGDTGVNAAGATATTATQNVPWNLKFGGAGVTASVPRIVLKDYLELSYAPGTVEGDTFAVYGRKIRFDKFSGSLDEPIVAYYCGIDTKDLTTEEKMARRLDIGDFCDYTSMMHKNSADEDRPFIKVLPSTRAEKIATADEGKTFVEDLNNLANYTCDSVSDLKRITKDSINCTIKFPSSLIGSSDMDTVTDDEITLDANTNTTPDEETPIMGAAASIGDRASDRPLFYCLLTCNNFQESGLLGWITSPSATQSTTWWNDWLKTHTYDYCIDGDSTLKYLRENYTFAMDESGIIMLNLDTLARIRADYVHEDNVNNTGSMRSFFKIMGYAFICYSFVLVGAWAVDVNVDLGLNILKRVTFGRMIAVANEVEVPKGKEVQQVNYVGFQTIMLSSFKILCVGLLLVFIDVVTLVSIITTSFGKLAVYISNIVGGV